MSKASIRSKLHGDYKDPFVTRTSHKKRAFDQVNGQTQQTYQELITQVFKKRNS